MLNLAQLDQVKIWKIVKETRKSFLSANIDPDCQFEVYNFDTYNNMIDMGNYSVLNIYDIEAELNELEKKLKLNQTKTSTQNVSDETLQIGAEIFIYLSFCPNIFKKYISFVEHVLRSDTPRDVILSLENIMKSSQIALKQSSVLIFMKVMEKFRLKMYEEIQIITNRRCYNEKGNVDDCKKRTNQTNQKNLG